ncbi:MAG: amino acid adenylation domain-containing protein, partial [Gemmatimonas sp.]
MVSEIDPRPHALHELFEQQVERTPQAIALTASGVDGSRLQLSYSELNRRVNVLARRLRALGVMPNQLVGVHTDRNGELVIGILAILKAGGAYLPLDPVYPSERIVYMLEDAGASIVLTQTRLKKSLASLAAVTLCIDDPSATRGSPEDEANLSFAASADDLAYVIYTSGSTGRPKGVCVTHRNVARLFTATDPWFEFSASDVWTLFHSYAFDFSVWEMWGALLYGGRLVSVPLEVSRSPDAFRALLLGEKVTVLNQTPTAFLQLIEADAGCPKASFALRHVIFGGEALLPRSLKPWIDRYGDSSPRLVNMYGITETTVHVTYRVLTNADLVGNLGSVIGVPIPDLQLYVLDPNGEPTPAGVPGELHVAGGGVAMGYLNRPELTVQRFIPDPNSTRPQARMYRSGDLVQRLPDGELVYLGRIDRQVKIRGFRIELGEIEARLGACDGVREAVVLAREDTHGERRLVAYCTMYPGSDESPQDQPRGLPSSHTLRAELACHLPEYMVPAAFVALQTMPLTPNGKVDRDALPAPDARAFASEEFEAPVGEIETALAHIWSEVLGLPQVGRRDSFFALGGHSLLAMKVIARIRVALQAELPLRILFDAPTIAALSQHLAQHSAESAVVFEPIPAREQGGPVPLSSVQTGMWLADRLGGEPTAYHLSWAIRLTGPLNRAALQLSLHALVKRHDSLRLYVVEFDGAPSQKLGVNVTLRLQDQDLSALPAEHQSEELARVLRAARDEPFDLALAPLARACLVRLHAAEHVLQIVLHHLISDGSSEAILRRELSELYAAFCVGRPAPAAPSGLGYLDFAAWEDARTKAGKLQPQLLYWTERLRDIVPLNLPIDTRAAHADNGASATIAFAIPRALVLELHALAKRQGATMFMLYLAAFKLLLMRWCGQDEIVVGTPIARRDRPQLTNLVGPLVNVLVLRTKLAGNLSFIALLDSVRDTALEAYQHQDQPFDSLVTELNPQRVVGRNPLFDVLVNSIDDWTGGETFHGLACEPIEVHEPVAKFPLTLYLRSQPEAANFMLNFRTDLLRQAHVARLAEQFEVLLTQIARRPDEPIASFSLITDSVRTVLPDPTLVLGPARPARIHDAFVQRAQMCPERIAVTSSSGTLSYRELEESTRGMAQLLNASGVAAGNRVVIVADRHLALIAAVLGCARAGALFTILDAAYPAARNADCIAQIAPCLILDCTGTSSPKPESAAPSIRVERSADRLRAQFQPTDVVLPEVDSSASAYISFTSGTSGRPKGIVTGHAALPHFVEWHVQQHVLVSHDRFSLLSGIAHDPLLRDIFTPLTIGATLCIPEQAELFEPTRLVAWLEREQISVVHLTPALGELIANGAEAGARLFALRRMFWGGEVLGRATIRRAALVAPNALHVNFYGTTETPQAMAHHAAEVDGDDSALPLGYGIDAVQVLVLAEGGALAAIGHPGEIVVRTPYLSMGYLDDAETTHHKFIRNPFTTDPADRCYRTGDLGRYRDDGSVEYVGRIDHQVKIRGFRVELGEIEAKLAAFPGVDEAVVMVREDNARDKRLVAYCVGTSASTNQDSTAAPLSMKELRTQLANHLPEYMVPAAFVALQTMPLTPNGKVDRAALPAPDASAFVSEEFEAPVGDIETELAGIWREVLGVEQLGRSANFFGVGGHSLKATQVVSRVRRDFGISLPVRAIFESPTLRAFAARLRLGLNEGVDRLTAEQAPRRLARRDGLLPTSFSQRRMWLVQRLNPGTTAYNIGVALEFAGPLDAHAMVRAVEAVAQRHEAFRTRFEDVDGEPMQRIVPQMHLDIERFDLRPRVASERRAIARGIVGDIVAKPFDLSVAGLHRIALLQLDEHEHVLLWSMHHAIGDHWSSGILLRELRQAYVALREGRHVELQMPALDYADYAAWQRERAGTAGVARQISYWRNHLEGVTPLRLPTDYPREQAHEGEGASVVAQLEPAVILRLKQFSLGKGVTPYMTLLACFQMLMARISGQVDVAAAAPIANR